MCSAFYRSWKRGFVATSHGEVRLSRGWFESTSFGESGSLWRGTRYTSKGGRRVRNERDGVCFVCILCVFLSWVCVFLSWLRVFLSWLCVFLPCLYVFMSWCVLWHAWRDASKCDMSLCLWLFCGIINYKHSCISASCGSQQDRCMLRQPAHRYVNVYTKVKNVHAYTNIKHVRLIQTW